MTQATVINVQYDNLATIATTFDQQSELTRGVLEKLRRQQAKLDAGNWLGLGAEAFSGEMHACVVPTMNRLIDALEQAAGTTRQVHERMQQAEADAAALFHGSGTAAVTVPSAVPAVADAGGAGGDSDNGTRAAKDGSAAAGAATVSGGTPFARGAGDAHDISPNDVTQGQLGDCYLMSSLAAIADVNPDVIRNMIKDNGDGSYTVTFKINVGGPQTLDGKRIDDYAREHGFSGFQTPSMYGPNDFITKEIRVTPDFPADGSGGQPRYAKYGDAAGGKPEMWVPLIEKAYGQMMGGYSDIGDGGHSYKAMANITGKQSIRFEPSDITMDEMADFRAKGHAIVLDTPNYTTPASVVVGTVQQSPVVPNHAYYVTNVDKAAGTVSVRNPWGWNNKELTLTVGQFNQIFTKGAITPTR